MPKTIKVMVVDDTITYRMITKKVAESIPGVDVVATASNGKLAYDKLFSASGSGRPDLVLLDVEMPVMDGMATLKKIRQEMPEIAVVMVSALSRSNANIIVECLNAGALDFVTKPLETQPERAKKALREALEPILKLVVQRKQRAQNASSSVESQPSEPVVSSAQPSPRAFASPSRRREQVSPSPATAKGTVVQGAGAQKARKAQKVSPGEQSTLDLAQFRPDLVLIGSSTGGPAALTKVLGVLGSHKALSVPMLIVQHMPPIFTASLAAQLSRASGLVVKEAEDGMFLAAGSITLARGGQHFAVRRENKRLLACVIDGPKVNECRPAVDVLFMSVVTEFSGQILAVILTGMGRDGTNGVDALKRAGKTYCITQDKRSCVVYGMPRSVDEKGLSDESLPLEQIGSKIAEICSH